MNRGVWGFDSDFRESHKHPQPLRIDTMEVPSYDSAYIREKRPKHRDKPDHLAVAQELIHFGFMTIPERDTTWDPKPRS
jgi:hypothetical protein